MADRTIENGDLWAAIRGLGLTRKTDEELQALIAAHGKPDALFASKVIVAAARQVMAAKLNRGASA